MTAPKRRWFRFSLAMLFAVVTVACLFMGWHMSVVQRRKAIASWANENAGFAVYDGDYGFHKLRDFPAWRQWLGERPMAEIGLPFSATKADEDRVKRAFPEARVRTRTDAQIHRAELIGRVNRDDER